MDHYKVLEVSPDATQSDIRKAYKRLAKLYHPDVNSSASAHTLFQHISDSYRVLSNPQLRAQFDAQRPGKFEYNSYSAENEPRRRAATHRRNPHSYRSAPPLRQEDLIRPYMRYAYATSWVGFILAIILAIDFFGPSVTYTETISQNYVLPGAPIGESFGRPQLIYTNEGTRMEVRAGEETTFLTAGTADVEKSLIFRFPRNVHLADGPALRPMVLLYGHLSFFPILLFLFSGTGAFLRKDIIFDFNVCLVAGVLSVITLVILVATR